MPLKNAINPSKYAQTCVVWPVTTVSTRHRDKIVETSVHHIPINGLMSWSCVCDACVKSCHGEKLLGRRVTGPLNLCVVPFGGASHVPKSITWPGYAAQVNCAPVVNARPRLSCAGRSSSMEASTLVAGVLVCSPAEPVDVALSMTKSPAPIESNGERRATVRLYFLHVQTQV